MKKNGVVPLPVVRDSLVRMVFASYNLMYHVDLLANTGQGVDIPRFPKQAGVGKLFACCIDANEKFWHNWQITVGHSIW